MRTFQKKSKEQWRRSVEAWKESGLGVRKFCREHGLAEGRFYSWRKRLGFGSVSRVTVGTPVDTSRNSPPAFLPIQLKEASSTGKRSAENSIALQRLEIFLGNGAIVRFSGELTDDNLSMLMRLASGASC